MKRKLFTGATLTVGSKEHDAVVFLQALLRAMKFNTKIVPDGDYGEQTSIGVRALQTKAGLKRTGRFDQKTLVALSQATGINLDAFELSDSKPARPARAYRELPLIAHNPGWHNARPGVGAGA